MHKYILQTITIIYYTNLLICALYLINVTNYFHLLCILPLLIEFVS